MNRSMVKKLCLMAIVGLLAAGTAWAQVEDGSIVGWGEQVVGVDQNADFLAAGGGAYHSLVLKADSSIVVWGDNGSNQWNVPVPNRDFVAVSAGEDHSLGLKSDLLAWPK